MSTLIQAEELRVGYGDRQVLHGLSFELEAGRTSVILGPGGSGKTTLLRALRSALDRPRDLRTQGILSLPEYPPCMLEQKPEEAAGCLTDVFSRTCCQRSTCEWASGCESWNGDGNREKLRMFWECAPAAAEELIPVLDRAWSELPRHQKRLAEFTATIARNSPILLLDEPADGLDDEPFGWIVSKLRELRGRRTIVLVTHHLRMAREIADVVMLLIDGEILEIAESSAFFERPSHPRAQQFVRWGS